MTTTNPYQSAMDNLMRQLSVLSEQAEKWEASHHRLAFIADLPVGTIIRFCHQFTPNGRDYLYAAIKAVGDSTTAASWYTSGPRKAGPFTWNQMMDFIGSRTVTIMSARRVVEEEPPKTVSPKIDWNNWRLSTYPEDETYPS